MIPTSVNVDEQTTLPSVQHRTEAADGVENAIQESNESSSSTLGLFEDNDRRRATIAERESFRCTSNIQNTVERSFLKLTSLEANQEEMKNDLKGLRKVVSNLVDMLWTGKTYLDFIPLLSAFRTLYPIIILILLFG